MMKLWGRATSSNVMKVIWLLEELRLPYERIDAGLAFGRTRTPEYRAMNPLGLVPTLEEDGFSLFESNAILRYVCNAHAPDTQLYPQALRPRATVDSWMEFQQTALNRPQAQVFVNLVRTPPEKRDPAVIDAAIAEAGAIWAIVDARLGAHGYVAGPDFTIADIAFGVHVHRWLNMDFRRPDLPHLAAWYRRLLERPAYKAHCAGAIV